MQPTGTVWTTLIGDHLGIIPVKFGQIPISGSREDVVWSFPYMWLVWYFHKLTWYIWYDILATSTDICDMILSHAHLIYMIWYFHKLTWYMWYDICTSLPDSHLTWYMWLSLKCFSMRRTRPEIAFTIISLCLFTSMPSFIDWNTVVL